MRMHQGVRAFGLLLAGGFALPVLGQIVTPPPAKAPGIADHIPPAPPPPPPPPPMPQFTPPPPMPTKAKAGDGIAKEANLPPMDFKSLVEKDEQGSVKPLTEVVDLAALRNNPTLPKDYMAGLEEYLKTRKATFERLAIDNLDIVEKVEGGHFDRADFRDRQQMIDSVVFIRPLTGEAVPKPITEDLVAKQKLDPIQAGWNKKIIREYQKSLYPVLPLDTPPEKKAEATARMAATVTRQGIDETMRTATDLQAEAAGQLVKAAEGLDAAALRALTDAAKDYRPGLAPDQKVKIYRNATAALSVDQRREILRKTVAMRGGK